MDYVEQEGFKTVEKKTRLTSAYDTAKEIYVVTLPFDAFKETDTVRLKVSDDGSASLPASPCSGRRIPIFKM